MSGYLVDTDWIIDFLNGREARAGTLDRLAESGLAISLNSFGELYEGAFYARDRRAALATLEAFLTGKALLAPTRAIMQRFGMLRGGLSRQLRNQIGDLDLIIAATAIEHDLTLVTRNVRDFQPVDGVKLDEIGSTAQGPGCSYCATRSARTARKRRLRTAPVRGQNKRSPRCLNSE